MTPQASGQARMPATHLLLALLVVAVWGTNFVVMHLGLDEFPPLMLGALRVFFASLPLLPFLPRPDVPLRTVITYGLLSGALQFGLMLYAMGGHISPGIASTLLQMQAFFTAVLAAVTTRERLYRHDLMGLAISGAGIALIGAHVAEGDASAIGIVCVLSAALAWAFANIIVRRARPARAISLVAWSNLIAVIPLSAATLMIDGSPRVLDSLRHASFGGWMVVLWQAYANALLGYSIWNWLLARHPASRIAPLALLVPAFGLGASAWYLAEPLQTWKLAAAGAVVAGLFLGMRRPATPA
ncbi:MAG: EamA family transporter [Alphaproteobacteria bacterium]